MGVPERTDVVVIGGGLVGTAAAYHLAKRGVGVTLLDKGQLASGASGRNGGLVGHWMPAPGESRAPYRYSRLGMGLIAQLEKELNADFEWRQCGSMSVATSEKEMEGIRERFEVQRREDMDAKLLIGDEARKMVPAFSSSVTGAAFCGLDGHMNPIAMVMAQAEAAKRLGAEIHENTAVEAIDYSGDRVRSVTTTKGEIRTNWVLNATNSWASQIGAMVGLEIPITPHRGQVLVTDPMPPLLPVSLVVNNENGSQYWHQEVSGNVVMGGGRWLDVEGVGTFVHTPTQKIVRYFTRIISGVIPELLERSVMRMWAGYMGFTPDWMPIVGECATRKGFVVGAGFNGSGLPVAAAVGLLTAQHIAGEPLAVPLDVWSPARFNL